MAKRSGRTALGQYKKGHSGNPEGRRAERADSKAAPARVARADGDWRNFFTGMGVYGRDKRLGSNFTPLNLSFDQLKDIYLGNDLAARAVETIPASAMRPGYDITISGSESDGASFDPQELASEVMQKHDALGTDQYLEICGNYEHAYGGSALLIGANDGSDDLTKPLNLLKVRSLDWLTPLEARELMPLYAYNDPRSPKYGQPEIYQLNSRGVLPSYSGSFFSTTMMIHESRLIPFPGIRVSRYQQTSARGGWGESVLTRIYRVLRDFDQAWSSAGVLVSDFAQSVIKIAGLWEALATDGEKAFEKRLQAMEAGRSTVNAVTIDAGDSYERQATPLAGLPDLLQQFAIRLAAACDMPVTLLFGTSPAGMNATGESDIRLFYDRVSAYQKRRMEPAIRRITQILFRIMMKGEPDKWSVKFRPLWQESEKDRAAAMLTQAQADAAWITAGVVSPEEVATSHWGQGEYNPNISIDFDSREAQELAAAAPVDQEAINAMDPNHYSYVPPPEPGSAATVSPVAPPGPAAAPDPNTRPVSIVQSADSASARRDAVADDVYDQLAEDYPPKAISWVKGTKWEGPVDVPLNKIDYSNMDSWGAAKEPKKVEKHEAKIRRGKKKPIILIDDGAKLMKVSDGHHRATAYKNLDQPARAYIAHVPKSSGPWDAMHDSQSAKADAWRGDSDDAVVAERSIAGMQVCIEVRAGDVRDAWCGPVEMPCDYGYLPGVRGADGDSLDAMVGDDEDSDRVYVIEQLIPRTAGEWSYLQDKVMLGFDTAAAARVAFVAAHGGDEQYAGELREVPLEIFQRAIEAARRAGGKMSYQLSEIGNRVDEWSDAAREAAIEARQKNIEKLKSGQPAFLTVSHGAQDKGREVGTHVEITPKVATAGSREGQMRYEVRPVSTRNGKITQGRSGIYGTNSPEEAHAEAERLTQYEGGRARARFGGSGQDLVVGTAPIRVGKRSDEDHFDDWSDAAREAAAETRRKNASGKPEPGKTEHMRVSHGMKDPKGREVGGHAEIAHDPKHGFGVSIEPTRNGEKHGAIRPTTWYGSQQEAHEAAINGLQKQGDRYREKFGPGETKLIGAPAAREAAAPANRAGAREAKSASAKAYTLTNNTQLMKEPEHRERAASLHDKAAEAQSRAGNDEKAGAHRAAATDIRAGGNGKPGPAPVAHGGHGEGGPHAEGKHPSGAEGKHGGEHGKGKGEGHKEGKEFGKQLGEGLKAVGETVAGEKASKVVGQLAPVGGGGEGGGEEE